MSEFTIPMLPCSSVKDMIRFYEALGFEIFYKEEKPESYASIKFGSIEIHFSSENTKQTKGLSRRCYVTSADIDGLYRLFTDSWRKKLGKVPSSGIPRVTPIRNLSLGEKRFHLVDPDGNRIHIRQKVTKSRLTPARKKTNKIDLFPFL